MPPKSKSRDILYYGVPTLIIPDEDIDLLDSPLGKKNSFAKKIAKRALLASTATNQK